MDAMKRDGRLAAFEDIIDLYNDTANGYSLFKCTKMDVNPIMMWYYVINHFPETEQGKKHACRFNQNKICQ